MKISQLIQNQHKQINKLYQNYLLTKGNIDDQQSWANQFQQILIRHLTAEEILLLPTFEKYLDKGDQFKYQDFIQHKQMKQLLFDLQTITITDPQFQYIFQQLIHLFNQHIQQEEIHLNQLEKMISDEINCSLTESFQQTIHSNQIKIYPTSSINPPI